MFQAANLAAALVLAQALVAGHGAHADGISRGGNALHTQRSDVDTTGVVLPWEGQVSG